MQTICFPGIGTMLSLLVLAPPVTHSSSPIRAEFEDSAGLVRITEAGRPVLIYRYRTVPVPQGFLEAVAGSSRPYARPRGDYLHPLHGPGGQELTRDWAPDHPHHRGIYWAWPEVQFGEKTGDLHALQQVRTRPTGRIETRHGDDWAEVEAESQWVWEDGAAIVRELAKIRAWSAKNGGRKVDLDFRFETLEEGVTLARRGTDKYGGLNIRLAEIADLQRFHHADAAGSEPRMAWQGVAGRWAGAEQTLSITVFESAANPYYPADFVEYPKLPWFQPAFPAAGIRFPLEKGTPLLLRYRIWIRGGPAPGEDELRAEWLSYNQADGKKSALRP